MRACTVWLAWMLVAGCSKETLLPPDCTALKEALAADAREQVGAQVNAHIQALASQQHTPENVNALARSLQSGCGITATVLCFGCIQTFPEQSEIKLSFAAAGATITKVIDISYTNQNRLTFVSMHE